MFTVSWPLSRTASSLISKFASSGFGIQEPERVDDVRTSSNVAKISRFSNVSTAQSWGLGRGFPPSGPLVTDRNPLPTKLQSFHQMPSLFWFRTMHYNATIDGFKASITQP